LRYYDLSFKHVKIIIRHQTIIVLLSLTFQFIHPLFSCQLLDVGLDRWLFFKELPKVGEIVEYWLTFLVPCLNVCKAMLMELGFKSCRVLAKVEISLSSLNRSRHLHPDFLQRSVDNLKQLTIVFSSPHAESSPGLRLEDPDALFQLIVVVIDQVQTKIADIGTKRTI
jgi:hypothetical protein